MHLLVSELYINLSVVWNIGRAAVPKDMNLPYMLLELDETLYRSTAPVLCRYNHW